MKWFVMELFFVITGIRFILNRILFLCESVYKIERGNVEQLVENIIARKG